ncbi:MAG: hypothetical protein M3O03_01850 [Pseudomonadota bacterium]|nr:hypothetical protein [Pseudomonadota bacterium]
MSNDDQNKHWLDHKDEGASPLVVLAMSAAKVTLYSLSGLVVLVLGVFVWQQQKTGLPMANGDWGMVSVLLILALLCLFMARKISKLLEVNR